jgi:hypothetical protein
MDLDDVMAELSIRRVLVQYCRGVDRGDLELLKGVYHPDATDDHGNFKGLGWDFAEALVPDMDRSSLSSQHHVTNVWIEREGDRAQVESYFYALHPVYDRKEARELHALAGGRYLDRFEKRDGAWKIADRRVVIDWTRRSLPGEDWALESVFELIGGRREADPSYGFLTTPE